jgi:hypothetical protein
MVIRVVGAGFALSLMLAASGAMAESAVTPGNAIFGKAAVAATSEAENKAIVGKGYYADYYGSYGIQSANYAAEAGSYGDYYSAQDYAYQAYLDFGDAIYYSNMGL